MRIFINFILAPCLSNLCWFPQKMLKQWLHAIVAFLTVRKYFAKNIFRVIQGKTQRYLIKRYIKFVVWFALFEKLIKD